MRASFIVPGILLGTALTSAANAQTVIQRTITQAPVETTVTQTPSGTIVTRRPLDGAAMSEEVAPSAVTTREVVRRAEVTRPRTRPIVTRSVSARPAAKKVTTVQRRVTPRLALTSAERHIVYQTIVEREVVPAPRVVPSSPYAVPPASYVAPQPPLINAQVGLSTAPVVAQDDDDIVTAPTYAVGTVLPASVPLYAVPQEVAVRVPAIQRYGYAHVGGRAYVVDPTTNVVVEDVTE
jgi:hypothetical protein